MFTDDVLFAGSIGRTDLPGGDHAAMLRTLREVVLAPPRYRRRARGPRRPDDDRRERAMNRYLQENMP